MGTVIQASEHFEPRRKRAADGAGQLVFDLESLILDATDGVQDSLSFTVRSLGLNVCDQELAKVSGGEPISALLFRWIGAGHAPGSAHLSGAL